jgi:hypothetical protein
MDEELEAHIAAVSRQHDELMRKHYVDGLAYRRRNDARVDPPLLQLFGDPRDKTLSDVLLQIILGIRKEERAARAKLQEEIAELRAKLDSLLARRDNVREFPRRRA